MKSESERYSLSVRLPSETIKRIEKSGEVPSAWLRQAVRLRMEREQQAGNTLDAVDGRMNRLEQEVAQLRNEIAKLHQSNAIAQAAQAEMRKVLVTIQGNQAELQRALIAMENGIGNTLAALGPTLLAAINQQIDQHAQAAIAAAKAKEERLRTLVPPAPPRTRL
jgi:transposase-like protein